jgi:parvulin-like peptidyl-prolyl isomerase
LLKYQRFFFICLLSCHHTTQLQTPTPKPSTQPTTQAATLPKEAPSPWLFQIFERRVSIAEYQNAAEEFEGLFNVYPEAVLAVAAYQIEFPEALGGQNPILAWVLFREILTHGATDLGLSVSSLEVQQELEKPALNYRQYAMLYARDYQDDFAKIIKGQGWSMDTYREEVARDLLVRKMLLQLTSQVTVPEEKLRELFIAQETQLSVSLLRMPLAPRMSGVKVSEAEAKAYLSKNETSLKARFQESSEAQVQVRARHILLKLPPDATPAEEKECLTRIKTIQNRLKAGEDFGNLAEEFSADSSASRGGDLGWSDPNAYVAEFRDALFAMKVGDISEPVRTRFGYHLIKLEESKTPKTFEESKLALATTALQEEKAKAILQKDAEELLAKAKKSKPYSLPSPPKKSAAEAYQIKSADFSLEALMGEAPLIDLGFVSPESKKVIAALTMEAPLATVVIQSGESALIVLLTKRSDPEEGLYATKREELLQNEKRNLEAAQLMVWLGQRLDQAGASLQINPEIIVNE